MRFPRPPAFLDLSNRNIEIPIRWIVLLIVIGVLSAAALLGRVVIRFGPEIGLVVSAMPLVVIGTVFTLTRRSIYPLVVLCLALFVPLSLPTGRDSRLVMSLVSSLVIFAAILLRAITLRAGWPFAKGPLNAPFVAWALVVLVAWGWSVAFRNYDLRIWPSFPFVQAASAVVMIMLPFLMLLTANVLKSDRQLQTLVSVFLAAGVIGLLPSYLGIPLPVNTRGMFNLWVIALASGLALFHEKLPVWQRALLGALAMLYVVWGVVLHVTWLAGWLPGLVALGVLFMMRSKMIAGIVAGIVVLTILVNTTWISETIANESAESGESRLAAWRINWSITKDHLLFGTGPAGYAAYYMTYLPDQGMATHSNYIDILAETGVVGLAVYLWLFGVVIWRGTRVWWRLRHERGFRSALASAALAGAVACLVIMGFGDWLIPFAYTQTIMGFDYAAYNWIFLGVLMALDRMTDPAAETQVLEAPAHV